MGTLYPSITGPLVWIIAEGEMRVGMNRTIGWGYSGRPEAKNDWTRVREQGIGPIPPGSYHIGAPRWSPRTGPFVLDLTPWRGDMFGRSGFQIHGDSIKNPGEASSGCIILPRDVRGKIAMERSRGLLVITQDAPDGLADQV